MPEEEIGKVVHYFDKISVAALELTAPLKVGDKILIKGEHDDVETVIESMQVEHEQVQEVGAGDEVAIKVPDKVHKNSKVYKVTE